MKTYAVTFGFGHVGPSGENLSNAYTTIDADTEKSAREKAFKLLGDQWAFMYDYDKEFLTNVDKYGMRFVCLSKVTLHV